MSEKESIPPLSPEELAKLNDREAGESREREARMILTTLENLWAKAERNYKKIAGGDELVEPGRHIKNPPDMKDWPVEMPRNITVSSRSGQRIFIRRDGDNYNLAPEEIDPDKWKPTIPIWKVSITDAGIEKRGLVPTDLNIFLRESVIIRVNGKILVVGSDEEK
ncbi:MAG: hypothetical protein WC457_03920 [Patescibacteria group bacterium]